MFDAHFHIIDPNFPLAGNSGFFPDPFTVEMYLNTIKDFEFKGGAIVSGSFQGFDQNYLLSALTRLGKNYVGVVNLPYLATDDEIISLYQNNIRAVRFNVFRGGSEDISYVAEFAKRAYALCGMHVELYIDGSQIEKHFQTLSLLPKFSIDHLGLTTHGLNSLFELVKQGAFVKATGFMRVDFDVLKVLQQIYDINPHALLFGTDLPGTRAPRQFNKDDLALIEDNFTQKAQDNIFQMNALRFYGFI